MNELKLRGAVAASYVVTGAGESTPIADESKGPSAMAKNRRVEIQVIPGSKATAPAPDVVGASRSAPAFGCQDLSLMIKLNKAEVVAWTMVETSGQSHGTPKLTFPDENVNQPTLVDWRVACRSAGIRDDAVIDAYYDNVKLPLGANILAHKRELERQVAEYQRMIDDPDGCDRNRPLDRWFKDPNYQHDEVRIKDKHDVDRMPGDIDPKGRRY